MSSTTGINALLYRIDAESVRQHIDPELSIAGIPGRLVREYNDRKKEKIFEARGQADVDGANLSAFLNVKSMPTTSSWVGFFSGIHGIEFGNLTNQLHHLVCFVEMGDELYAFTAGQSAVVFERFIDLAFPVSVGRRIAKPEVKAAHANQITGATLASDLHFRDSRRITYTESLDTVWTSLSGYLREEKLTNKDFIDIFGVKKKVKIDVSSSLRLGPKIQSPKKMVSLITWLAEQESEDLPDDDGWSALDAIELLNPRKQNILIGNLRNALAEKIFIDREYSNLALAHADISRFASATRYVVRQGNKVLYDQPEEPSMEAAVANVSVGKNLVDNLSKVTIEAIKEDYSASYGTEGPLLGHLNGEINHDGKIYLLLAGKWYKVEATYIDQIEKDLLHLLISHDIRANVIGLRPWRADESEGDYNKSSLSYNEYINGDTVLTDNIELFDTLAFKGNSLHIIHVKKGFNVKLRDVRSQLVSSAHVIEDDLRGDRRKLKMHHRQLVLKKRTSLPENEFIALFERPRSYVFAYGTQMQVEQSSLSNFSSSVAKMEVVSLCSQFRQIGTDDSARLRIAWIPVT